MKYARIAAAGLSLIALSPGFAAASSSNESKRQLLAMALAFAGSAIALELPPAPAVTGKPVAPEKTRQSPSGPAFADCRKSDYQLYERLADSYHRADPSEKSGIKRELDAARELYSACVNESLKVPMAFNERGVDVSEPANVAVSLKASRAQ